ncbi:MAG: histone H1 [Capsulimonadaceae bacterium]
MNEAAFRVVQQAIGESPDSMPDMKELGRLGGLRGGNARAAKLSAEERSDIAKRAAEARWRKRHDS